ncbi:NAD-dependent epimerase/dehydratase family protein [Pedobacter caeni]|uniref:Nucleoside-diphosphate-sugar epimerase n=1 Tax=Pedobacter caeni TaxID=288992 RepID=A0A1M4T704_9SPHI|nr:NAD-dependent epimerase/dehydratase family protein [Pedobacter caeni]SHE40144.1 Nucleoside-diphosphate-sugar epimerase [Pedobacter caeni]
MHVLIIGGTGFIGNRLAQRLATEGHHVTVLGTEPLDDKPNLHQIIGDRSSLAILETLKVMVVDAVIDLIAYHPSQVEEMIAVFDGRISKYILLSTIAVYAPPFSFPLKESGHTYAGDGPDSYGALKARCESILNEAFSKSAFPSVILRSAPIMGPGDPVSRELYFLKRIQTGEPMIYPWAERSHVLNIFIGDLVTAFSLALKSGKATGNTYHLSFGDSPTMTEYLQAIAGFAGKQSVPIAALPLTDLMALGFSVYAFPYFPGAEGKLDLSNASADLGFRPTPFKEALQATFADLPAERTALTKLPSWPGRNATQTRLCGTHEFLHEALERQTLEALPKAQPSNIDQLLGKLINEHHGFHLSTIQNWTTGDEVYEEMVLNGAAPQVAEVLLVADEIAEKIKEFRSFDIRYLEKASALLTGVIEKRPNHHWLFDCYVVNPPAYTGDYTADNRPLSLQLVDFCEPEPNFGSADRFLIFCAAETSYHHLCKWLLNQISDFPKINLRLLGSCYLMTNQVDNKTGHVVHLPYVFDLARALTKAGHAACNKLTIGNANDILFTQNKTEQPQISCDHFITDLLKITIDGEYYLFDITQKKLLAISKILAYLVDYFTPTEINAAMIGAIFGFPEHKAAEIAGFYDEYFKNELKSYYKEAVTNDNQYITSQKLN